MSFATNKLWAERYLGMATYDDCVDWAVACLEADVDTKNIRILASLRNQSSPSEVEDYFNRSLKDLGWTMPEERECLLEYARGVAQQIVSGDLRPLDGCRKMYNVFDGLGDHEMISWLYLDEGLHPDYGGDLEAAEWDDAIKIEAARFLRDNTELEN